MHLAGGLTAREQSILNGDAWGISPIVLWEIAKLRQRGRIEIEIESPDFSRVLRKLHVFPIDAAICAMSTELDFQSDPADELIAATSVVNRVPLVTRDEKIRRSLLVPFAL